MFYGSGTFSCLVFRRTPSTEVKKWLTGFLKPSIEYRNANKIVFKKAKMKQSKTGV